MPGETSGVEQYDVNKRTLFEVVFTLLAEGHFDACLTATAQQRLQSRLQEIYDDTGETDGSLVLQLPTDAKTGWHGANYTYALDELGTLRVEGGDRFLCTNAEELGKPFDANGVPIFAIEKTEVIWQYGYEALLCAQSSSLPYLLERQE